MSILRQKSRHKVEQKVIRVQEPVAKPKARPQSTSTNGAQRAPTSGSSSRTIRAASGTPRASPRPGATLGSRLSSASPLPTSSSGDERRGTKRKASRQLRKSPANTPLSDDSEPEEGENGNAPVEEPRERERAPDPDRIKTFRHPKLWDGDDATAEEFPMVHAEEVASLAVSKYKAEWNLGPDELSVELRYPGSKFPERFNLVVGGHDDWHPLEEILSIVKYIADFYVADPSWSHYTIPDSPNPGVYRWMKREAGVGNGPAFKAALDSYNRRMLELQQLGSIAKGIDAAAARQGLPRGLTSLIMEQAYARTSAMKIDLVHKYDNGTSEVYGELTHKFVSAMVDKLDVTSKTVFVDLGSGIGNIVMQMALETGCESWGCEIKENPCDLAEEQLAEFEARCRLWGIRPGPVHLERGDFTKNERILAVLQRADVILCNNFVFAPELNNQLVQMFLDLKIGARVVSLKSFVHDQKEGSNDVAASIFDVKQMTYPEDYVSWTDKSGTWYVSTRK